jgi:hypothetical protein
MRTPLIAIAGVLVIAGLSGCGTLAPSFKTDLTATLGQAKGRLSDCYQQALIQKPNLAGTMTVRFTVPKKRTGLSEVAVVDRPGTDPALDRCVVRVVGALQVPTAPKLNVNVEFPLTLTPKP